MYLSIIELFKMKLPCTANFYQLEESFRQANPDAVKEVRTKPIHSPTMKPLSPTAAMRKEGFDFTEASGSTLKGAAEDKMKHFQGKVKDRQNTKKQVIVSADPESPSMQPGNFVRLANQKGKDGNKFASPSHILNPSAV